MLSFLVEWEHFSAAPAAVGPPARRASHFKLGVNLHGEFDFSDDTLKDSLRFDMDAPFASHWEPQAAPSG